MEKYSKAVSEMYAQFKRKEAHPMEKYIGRPVNYRGGKSVVVGYSGNESDGEPLLIIEASQSGGWSALGPSDVVFKECEYYWYASISELACRQQD